MAIVIQTPARVRARALAAANPQLTPEEVGRRVGLSLSSVQSALASNRQRRRKKSVAP